MSELTSSNGFPRKACIIGAGSSGIAAAKTLRERGIPYDCFEMGSGIGGMWRYDNDNGPDTSRATSITSGSVTRSPSARASRRSSPSATGNGT
ncbi:MAG: Flavin-containing monooxygenase [Planctomycetota bacterium]|nr:MAG: Flavin-containing monooxygenase [Planctomycetota bacterium]